jgi:hypothetical protein
MKGNRLIVCCLSGLLLNVAGCSNAATETSQDQFYKPPPGNREATHAYISDALIFSPLGKFLLVREGAAACVVRFTAFHREGEEKKGTVFFSREPIRTAEAEWYFQGDGSFDFSKPSITSGKVSLRNMSSFGFGRLSFKPTATLGFSCGSISIGWFDGIYIDFTDENGHWDFEREIAPSKWADLKDVDFSNPRLIWTSQHKYQSERPEVKKRFIPMEELP